jgi:hypothetical protein
MAPPGASVGALLATAGNVEAGIPEKAIAFVRDAQTDVQQAALFKAVREGRVRVLLGSTAKMGVGANVQTLLVAPHRLDAPWRPCDVEQREGRMIERVVGRFDATAQLEIRLKRLDDLKLELARAFEHEARLAELLVRQRELLRQLDLDKGEAGTMSVGAEEIRQAA